MLGVGKFSTRKRGKYMDFYSNIKLLLFSLSPCKATDCQGCLRWECPVKNGQLQFAEVEPYVARFKALHEKSRIPGNPECFYGECDDCENVSCGVWHGLAPEPTMPEELKNEWNEFLDEFLEFMTR